MEFQPTANIPGPLHLRMDTLPNEIWHEVFAICAMLIADKPLNYQDFPLNIMWTCKTFKALIISYSPAWTGFTLHIGRHTDLMGYRAILDTLYSVQVPPLGLNLHFPSRGVSRFRNPNIEPPAFSRRNWNPFMMALGRNLSSFTIHNVSTTELASIPDGAFPFLQSLVCTDLACTSLHPVTAFASAPRLAKVALRPFSAKLILPPRGLTHLAMWNCGPTCLTATDLSKVEMLHISTGVVHLPPYNPSNPIPALKYLSVENENTYNFSRALIPLMGRALTTLTLVYEDFRRPHLGPAFDALCPALKECCSLQSLGILSRWAEHTTFQRILASVPNIRKLELGMGHWHGKTYHVLCSREYVPHLEHLCMHVREPLPEHLEDDDTFRGGEEILHNQMSLSQGRDRVQSIIHARGCQREDGALTSFTFLEWENDWSEIARELSGTVTVTAAPAAIMEPPTRVGEILSRDSDSVQWPELKALVTSVTANRVMVYRRW